MLAHPECNAFCRGKRHAQVVAVRRDLAGEAPAQMASLCAGLGVRFVAAEPAKEAPVCPPEVGWDRDGAGVWRGNDDPDDMARIDPDDYDPWLLVWEVAHG